MGRRKQVSLKEPRSVSRNKRSNSTLWMVGSMFVLSLSFCPVVLMMSTTADVLSSKSTVDGSSIATTDLDEQLRLSTPFLTTHFDVSEIEGTESVLSSGLDHATVSPTDNPLKNFDLLEDNDELTISMGGSDWAIALENLNTSQHRLGQLGRRRFHDFNGSLALGNLEPGIFQEEAATSSDDLFVIPKKMLVKTFEAAEEKWLSTRKIIDERFSQKKGADAKGPIGTAFAFNAPNEESLALSNTSSLLEIASRAFLQNLETEQPVSRRKRNVVKFEADDSKSEATEVSNSVVFEELDSLHSRFVRQSMNSMSGPAASCGLHDEVLPCETQSKYRTWSGWCNNVRNPAWGRSVITFDRMVSSKYDDGISAPKMRSVTGAILPSPRRISSTVHIDVTHLSNRHTLMLMQFGQFVDHDITFTPVHKGPEGKILNCRDCESQLQTHPECWPIQVGSGDAYYPPMNRDSGRPNCIPFTRSLPGQQRLGPRDQINQNSAYLDSSQIYGENLCKANSLRSPGGKLNVTAHPVHGAKPLLPQITFLKECKSPSGFCFYAGDPRASEQPALAAVHTIYLRAHNRWADGMRSVNSHWNDEQIYQEVRRIMSAVNQHIIYNEMLPRLLGNSMINAYSLGLQNDGYYAGYDSSCPSNIYNEFATAAFRYGHSMVRPNLARMDNRYNGMNPHIALRDGFFNSDMLYHPLMVDELMRGLLGEPMEQLDPFMTKEITNHLFEDKKKQFSGMDLIALNIHRGRDHGLDGYNSYREVCSLKRATTFQDLSNEIPSDVLVKLKEVYAHVDDIDLFTGSISEKPVQGGLLGPTMTCIIGTQFKRLRQCDRFWYETNDPAIKFTPQQLAEIRKMTLSKIICDNLDMPSDIQRYAFDAPHNILLEPKFTLIS
ncbi:unnamed protein product [Orchesella dallaii]|uniref:Chorion peroxidase n=1 Tax=Orchesella dallaii TaxID=48710 RepID=A0ABP1QC61_9HEXA